MKYIEYFYLTLSLASMGYVMVEWMNLPLRSRIVLLIVVGLFGFMYSFRRGQRLKWEKQLEKHRESMQEESDSDL